MMRLTQGPLISQRPLLGAPLSNLLLDDKPVVHWFPVRHRLRLPSCQAAITVLLSLWILSVSCHSSGAISSVPHPLGAFPLPGHHSKHWGSQAHSPSLGPPARGGGCLLNVQHMVCSGERQHCPGSGCQGLQRQQPGPDGGCPVRPAAPVHLQVGSQGACQPEPPPPGRGRQSHHRNITQVTPIKHLHLLRSSSGNISR